MMDLVSIKVTAAETIKSTADYIKKGFYGDVKFQKGLKGVSDYQTFVDTKVEREIYKKLSASFPDWGFLGEENINKKEKGEYLWILDPICSTNNFVFGLPLFGVALGLLKQAEVLLSLIYLPVFDHLLWAIKNKGTFLNDKPVKVSNRKALEEAMILYDNQFHKSDKMLPNLIKLSDKCFTIRITGSAAYDMFSVASGLADARIFHKTKFYDFLPASLLIEESGGCVTNFKGQKVSLSDTEVLASNGSVHNEILKIIN